MLRRRPQKTLISEALEADERPPPSPGKEDVERIDRVRRRINTRTHLVFVWSLLAVIGLIAAITLIIFLLRML
ncbi:MAG: hypothetical protein HQ559_03280 [Lentisphaerae bacterium]|nr:hypothetical protein [Lentisphaerota bacterium]